MCRVAQAASPLPLPHLPHRFRSPELSAVALLSFSVYVGLTIGITQWRKKIRAQQNRTDNRYHDLATDSLLNFETVMSTPTSPYIPLHTHHTLIHSQRLTTLTQLSALSSQRT